MVIAASLLNVSEFYRAIQVIELDNFQILTENRFLNVFFEKLDIRYHFQNFDNGILICNNANQKSVLLLNTDKISNNQLQNHIYEIFLSESKTSLTKRSLILVSKNGNVSKSLKKYCDNHSIPIVGFNKPKALNKTAKNELALPVDNFLDIISRINLGININVDIPMDSIINCVKYLPDLVRLIQSVLGNSGITNN